MTPTFDSSPRTFAVLKAALRILKPRVSLRRQAALFSEHMRPTLGDEFEMTQQRWNKFALIPTKKFEDEALHKAVWDWLAQDDYVWALNQSWEETPGDSEEAVGFFARSLHTFFSGDNHFNLRWLQALKGEFEVFRPFFFMPDQVMICSLEFGFDEGDLSRFRMVMDYSCEEGSGPDIVEGVAVPYQDCIYCFGKITGIPSPCSFIVSDFTGGERFGSAFATLLVGAGGSMASAYPMVLRRATKPPRVGTYTREAVSGMVSNWKSIERALERGIVKWRDY